MSEGVLVITMPQLVKAFELWHGDVPKNDDGTLAGHAPDDAEAQAKVLRGYMEQAAA